MISCSRSYPLLFLSLFLLSTGNVHAQLPSALLLSTGLGQDAGTSEPLPRITLPTSYYSAGACAVFATPVQALATGIATIFTLSASTSTGGNINGILLGVYPDADGQPGWPPLFDGLLSGSMCWQQNFGTTNASLFNYTTSATWLDHGTISCNITGGVGLANGPVPVQWQPNGGASGTLQITSSVKEFKTPSLWNAHRGKAGIPIIAGGKYWVAFSGLSSSPQLLYQQADTARVAGTPMKATLTSSVSCPTHVVAQSRLISTYPSGSGPPAWTPASDVGIGLAINFCSGDAQSLPGGGACMVMPPVSVQPPAVPAPVVVPDYTAPAKSAVRYRYNASKAVPGLIASTGMTWSAPATLPANGFLVNCSLVATPVLAQTTSTITVIAASIAVKASNAPWNDWRQTLGAPYIPGLHFGVFADHVSSVGTPGSLIWSAFFNWSQINPVEPFHSVGSPYWREYNTFFVDLSAPGANFAPLSLTEGSIYWLAIGGSGNRSDATAGNDWDFQQASKATAPRGYNAQKTIVNLGTACSTNSFPADASGALAWENAAESGSLDSAGPAINLCDANTITSCTELAVPPPRIIPDNAVSSPPGTTLASSGVNAAPNAVDTGISLPASYFSTGCSLIATPVRVLATGTLSTIRVSVSKGGTAKLTNGIMLGIHADNAGVPGDALYAGWVSNTAILPVNNPIGSFSTDLDDWNDHYTSQINITGASCAYAASPLPRFAFSR